MSNPNQLHTSETQVMEGSPVPSYAEGLVKDKNEDFLEKDRLKFIDTKDKEEVIRFVLAPSAGEDEEANSVGLIPYIDSDGNEAFQVAINDIILEDYSLKQGQRLPTIGRNNFAPNSKTEFISRNHLDIYYAKGYIQVNNNGTNGTKIEYYHQPTDEETIGNVDLIEQKNSSQMDDLEDFGDFVSANKKALDTYRDKDSLTSCFYEHYCMNAQLDEHLINSDDFVYESTEEFEKTKQILDKYSLTEVETDYWRGLTVGDFDYDGDHGRIYLNPKNTDIVKIYNGIIRTLTRNGASFQIKMPKEINRNSYNRSDKMVLYFDKDNAQRVKDVLLEYLESNNDKMNTNVPRFSKRLNDAEGQPLRGVSFAENPIDHSKSYNKQIAEILAGLYLSNKGGGDFSIDDPEVLENFTRSCRRLGVDPHAPYKNINSAFDMF